MQLKQILKSNKGVSLPLVTGLVAFLMISAVAVNELIIRNMQSVRRIEASNRAYLAAEAGVEDALYELSSHFAGYKTPSLTDPSVRTTDFGGNVKWENNWEIESHSGQNTWGTQLNPDQPLKLYPNQKLRTYLFNDINYATANINAINQGNAVIETLNVSDFSIIFTIPDVANIIGIDPVLQIDNDEDNYLNEDAEGANITGCGGPQAVEDEDCDGLVNEDSDEDPVILWKLTDGAGRSLIPYKGCLISEIEPEHSEICEKDFNIASNYSVELDETATGQNQDGNPETIGDFIFSTSTDAKLHFEFLIIAPMDHFTANKKISIPYLEYEVSSTVTDQIPYPYFTIKSDGYYGNYKQSITSTLTPKTTVPLFDFTIIQQR